MNTPNVGSPLLLVVSFVLSTSFVRSFCATKKNYTDLVEIKKGAEHFIRWPKKMLIFFLTRLIPEIRAEKARCCTVTGYYLLISDGR